MKRSVFYFDKFSFQKNTGEISFSYHVDEELSFEERVVFTGAPFQLDEQTEQALTLDLF